jgi:signal transduction histidine kinase
LKQIILNFVSNALKFTQSGYVEIKVEAVESGSDKSKALL